MRLRSHRALVAGAAAVIVLLAGGATALAESGSSPSGPAASSPRTRVFVAAGPFAACGALPLRPPLGDPVQAAADYLGVSVDQLTQQLQGGKSLAEIATEQGKSVTGLKQALLTAAKANLDRAVAAGEMTADQEQQLLAQFSSQIDAFVNGKGDLSIKIRAGAGPAPSALGGGLFKTAADYLGLSLDQMLQELQGGKSLAEIATEQGRSVAGLEQALVAAATAELNKEVTSLVNQKGLPAKPCAGIAVARGAVLRVPGFGPPGSP